MRTVLHSDLNNCFASIESIAHPEYRKIPFAVGGDEELRHGIILAKNECAKKFGIKTGEPLLSARQKCPELTVVKPNFELYDTYCSAVRQMYSDYTDQVEAFGMDECWLDVTCSENLFGNGKVIAEEIRRRVKKEFDLTVSIGVSFNKVFAKLGSDYKKPDAVTEITPDNYREIVWPLAVEELLFVGRATKAKLNRVGVRTIGDLANMSENFLATLLGKNGVMLHEYANGRDAAPVRSLSEADVIKSIGNSTTPPRDMQNEQDVNVVFHMLSEQVCRRLRSHALKCSVVQISLRSNELTTIERQMHLKSPTDLSDTVCNSAMALLREHYRFTLPLRSVGIRAAELSEADRPVQLTFFGDEAREDKLRRIEQTKDAIIRKYGKQAIRRAVLLTDRTLLPEWEVSAPTSVFRSH